VVGGDETIRPRTRGCYTIILAKNGRVLLKILLFIEKMMTLVFKKVSENSNHAIARRLCEFSAFRRFLLKLQKHHVKIIHFYTVKEA
jgi:hypothetical protein